MNEPLPPLLNSDLRVRAEAFCDEHQEEFRQAVNEYLSVNFLRSIACYAVACSLLATSLLMAWRTESIVFIWTHLFSFVLLMAYPRVSRIYKSVAEHASYFSSVMTTVVVLEGIWVFYLYHKIDMLQLMPPAAPFILAVSYWALNIHASRRLSIAISLTQTAIITTFLAFISYDYARVNGSSILIGSSLGLILNNLLYNQLRYRFFYIETERHLRTHAYKQLEKVAFPHQRRMIEAGHTLEQTMPVGWGDACVLSFDIVESSKIKSENKRLFLQNVLKSCHQEMMKNYNEFTLEANAYRIKEMGDGLLCSVGYPFKTPKGHTKEQIAIVLAQNFIRLFHEEAERLLPGEQVFCCIGIAKGAIESFYPVSYPKEYDIYGLPLVLATRYEGARKELFNYHEASSLVILAENVYDALGEIQQKSFRTQELRTFRIRDDIEARKLYFQTFADISTHESTQNKNLRSKIKIAI